MKRLFYSITNYPDRFRWDEAAQKAFCLKCGTQAIRLFRKVELSGEPYEIYEPFCPKCEQDPQGL